MSVDQKCAFRPSTLPCLVTGAAIPTVLYPPRARVRDCRDRSELRQRGLQVLDDLLRDHLGRGQVVHVLERLVAQPGDVEADLVARDSSS